MLLEEYKALRTEVATTMQSQISILAFGAATIGFSFAAAAQTADKNFRGMFLLVLVPLLCYLILTVWYAEVMRMLRAGTYLMRLEKRFDEQFQIGALSWESTIFQIRSRRQWRAALRDPDRFRTYAIALLFWTIAGTSIAIGWHGEKPLSWQHFFAIGALFTSIAVLVWLRASRMREVERLATPPLREGDRGIDVSWLQTVLKGEGLYAGAVEESFGPLTSAAVRTFQERSGLEPDGVVGLMTMDLLEENDSRRRGNSGHFHTRHRLRLQVKLGATY